VTRGEATRERILDAARALFGEQGFERTTVRQIAGAAAINPSMVIRYFGSKEGLFAAATEIDLRVADLASVPDEMRGETIVARFLDRWEGPDAGEEMPIMLRAAASHEGAREKYLDAMDRQVRPMVATICPPDRVETCMALCATQLGGLALTRYVLRVPGVVALKREEIVRRVGAVIQGYLSVE
jgi:AcrR family transcriptional regulator